MVSRKQARRLFSSLRFKLLLMIILVVLSILGLVLYSAFEQRRNNADNAHKDMRQLSDLVAAEQEQLVEGARQLLTTLAQIPEVREADLAACKKIFTDVVEQTLPYDNASLVDLEGNLLTSALDPGGPVNVIDRPYFQQVLRTRDFTTGDYLISKVTGTPIMLFAYPLLDEEGQVFGVVSTRINLGWLNEFIAGVELPPDSELLVVDRNGIVLARNPDPEGYVGQTLPEESFVQAIIDQPESGIVDIEGLDGVRRSYTFSPLFADEEGNAAYVIIGFSEEAIYSEANRILTRNLIILGLFTVLILMFAWVLTEVFVLRRMKTLTGMAERVGEGDLSARSGLSHDSGELGRLACSFDDMAGSLELRSEERDRAEESLKESEERLAGIVETAPVGIVIVGRDGGISFANTAAEKILGLERSDISGRTYNDPDWRITAVDGGPFPGEELPFSRVMATGKEVRGLEHAIEHPDGTRIILSINAVPLHDADGNISGMVASFNDITERRHAEQELRDSRAMIERIIDTTPNIIYIFDLRESGNVYINRNIYTSLGYSPQQVQEMGGSIIEKLVHPDDQEKVVGFYDKFDTISDGEILDLEYRHITADGETRWFYSRTTIFSRDDEGRPLQVLGEVQDITERKLAEERAKSLNRFYSVLSAVDRAIVRIREPVELLEEACRIAVEQGLFKMAWVGIVNESNRLIEPVAWHGVEKAYIDGIRISIDYVPEGYGPTGTAVREGRPVVCNDIENDPYMEPWRDKAARQGYRSSAAFPLRSLSGVNGVLSVYSPELGFFDEKEISLMEELASDISFALESIELEREREQAEEKLQRGEGYHRSIIRNAPDMITILNGDLTFRWGSPSSGKITGHAAQDIYGKSVFDYIHPDEEEYTRDALDFIVNNPGQPVRVEFRFRHEDGSYHHHEGTFSNLLDDPSVRGIVCNTRDTTERREAEEDVRRAMERLLSLHEMDTAILEARSLEHIARTALKHLRRLIPCRRAGVVLIDMVSQKAEILSYDADSATSIRPGTTFSTEGGILIEGLRKGEMGIIEDIDSIRNPHPVYVQLRAEGIRSGLYLPLTAHGEIIGLLSIEWDKPRSFSPTDMEIEIGREVASHLAVALYNARLFDEVQRHADLLEQRVAERTAQLEAANRELEAFSYSVSHDLRAPLRGMDGFSKALLEDYSDSLDEQGRDYLNRVRAASRRMARLIDDILELSRVARFEMRAEEVDLSGLAGETAEELKRGDLKRDVEFVIQPGLATVGDPRLLAIVLGNLLDNAYKFTGEKPKAAIEFGAEEREGKRVYYVRDNGVGFDMSYSEKLFDAFQRLHTEDEFPGTGIGLATVRRIIYRHGGEVWAESEVGEGAVFYFTLSPGRAPEA